VPQPDFLNAVLVVNDPERESHDWLKLARELETEAGRERSERWGPRVMDVDVIQVRDERGAEVFSDDPELVLPHPRASIRAFVLLPWLEVEASARLAGQSVAELLTSLPPGELSEVRLRDDLLLGER
jgi:2-amino-4-hydroxy-6-hydroxymethyldihydropteridine diphosphokinase